MENLKKNRNQIAFILYCFLPSVFFLINPSKFPADDGFFYPQIAYNIAHGQGVKFNDLYLTNGFHPLWMIFCVFAEILNFSSKQNVLYILWFFQVSFLNIGFILLTKKFFQGFNISTISAVSFLIFIFFSLGTLFLTEAHLNFLCIVLLLYYLANNNKNDFWFGFFSSLVFLARLDNFIIITFLGLFFWKSKKYSFTRLLKIILGFSILSVPYLFSNYYVFGNVVPISGIIKNSFPHIHNISLDYLQISLILTNLAYLLILIIKDDIFKELKIYYTLGSLCMLFYNIFFLSQIGQWYYVNQIIITAFLIYDILKNINLKILKTKRLIIISSLIIFSFLNFIGWLKVNTNLSLANNIITNNSSIKQTEKDNIIELNKTIASFAEPNTRIFVYDSPGKFAFYSYFNIIPSDGLVANRLFFKEINSMSFKNYLEKNKIEFLILPSHFHSEKRRNFVGISHQDNRYIIRNSLNKKDVSSFDENYYTVILIQKNPLKTWQKDYDSIKVYRTKPSIKL